MYNFLLQADPVLAPVATDDITEVEAEGSVNTDNLEVNEDKPYKRPNYKKRYDDLKKHYDNKLTEFKHREEELLNQVQQPEYKAPKTEEELEKLLDKIMVIFRYVKYKFNCI